MKRLPLLIAVTIVLATAMLVSSVAAGNGIDLNGPHYNLNLVGMKNTKNMPQNLDNGHVIFVRMGKNEEVATRIYLSESPEPNQYQVIDKDGTDGIARFELPQPYPDGFNLNATIKEVKCYSSYQVYVRVLGTPGGHGNITTGVCTPTNQDKYSAVCDASGAWMSTESVTLSSHGNEGKFVSVTKELTTVYIGGFRYGLFSDTPYGDLYFWELYNEGMKLIQLRFYPTPDDYCDGS